MVDEKLKDVVQQNPFLDEVITIDKQDRSNISQRVPIGVMYGPSHSELYGPYTRLATIVTAQPPCPGCASGMKHHCRDSRYNMR